MNVADVVWEHLRKLTVADFSSHAAPFLRRWVHRFHEQRRRLGRCQQRPPPREAQWLGVQQAQVAVFVTDLSPSDLCSLLAPWLARVQTFDAAADSASALANDAAATTGPDTVLIYNVHALDGGGLHTLLLTIQAVRPLCRLAVLCPLPAELLCNAQLLGKRCRLLEWVEELRLLDAAEVFERLVYRAFINNPMLPFRLTAPAMQQVHKVWGLNRSINEVLRFIRLLLHRHLIHHPGACLTPLLLPRMMVESATSSSASSPSSSAAAAAPAAPTITTSIAATSGNHRGNCVEQQEAVSSSKPEHGQDASRTPGEDEECSQDVLCSALVDDVAEAPSPASCNSDRCPRSTRRRLFPEEPDPAPATSSSSPAMATARALPPLDAGWADPRCPAVFCGLAHLLAFLQGEVCADFAECCDGDGENACVRRPRRSDRTEGPETSKRRHSGGQSGDAQCTASGGDEGSDWLSPDNHQESATRDEQNPGWRVGVPRRVRDCMAVLPAEALDALAADAIKLTEPNRDRNLQAVCVEEVHAGFQHRRYFTRCVAQDLQDLHLHLFAFSAAFDLLFAVFHTIRPRHSVLQGAEDAGPPNGRRCTEELRGGHGHLYRALLEQGKPIARTEAMRECLALVARISKPTLLLTLLKACIHALRGYGDDADCRKESKPLLHTAVSEASAHRLISGSPEVPVEGLPLPELHPLVQRMREARYGRYVAELTEWWSDLQQQQDQAAVQVARTRLDKFLRHDFPDFSREALPAVPLGQAVLLHSATYTGEWWTTEWSGEQESCHDGENCLPDAHFGLHTVHLFPTRRCPHLELRHTNLYGLAAPNNTADHSMVPDALIYRLLAEESRGVSRAALQEKFCSKLPAAASADEKLKFRQQFEDALQTLLFSNALRVRNQLIAIA